MREGGGGGPFERMDHTQLIQGFSDQTKVADAHFLDLPQFDSQFFFLYGDFQNRSARPASLKRPSVVR